MKNQIKFTLWQDDVLFYQGYFESLQSAKNWLSRCVEKNTIMIRIDFEVNGEYKLLASKNVKDKSWVNHESYKGEFKGLGLK